MFFNLGIVLQEVKTVLLIEVALVSTFLWYYLFDVVKKPKLICKEGPLKSLLKTNVTLLNEKFWPTIWCFEGRLQTVVPYILRTKIIPKVKYRREIFQLSDGGQVALDWTDYDESGQSPVVIILPGLNGSSQGDYVRCFVMAAREAKIRCVVFNNRGQAGVKLLTPKLYCAATYDDLEEVVDHVKKVCPHVHIGATGISLGGMILGQYIAGTGSNSKIDAAMIISSPINVVKGSESIERPYVNARLSQQLTMDLKKSYRKHEILHGAGTWSDDEVYKSKTVRDFDSAFTAKHFGFSNVDEYYKAACIHDKLIRFKVPVLALMAADDPFQPYEALPVAETLESDNFAMIVTNRGGHIGFMEGLWVSKDGQNQYFARVWSQYFSAIFNARNTSKQVN